MTNNIVWNYIRDVGFEKDLAILNLKTDTQDFTEDKKFELLELIQKTLDDSKILNSDDKNLFFTTAYKAVNN